MWAALTGQGLWPHAKRIGQKQWEFRKPDKRLIALTIIIDIYDRGGGGILALDRLPYHPGPVPDRRCRITRF